MSNDEEEENDENEKKNIEKFTSAHLYENRFKSHSYLAPLPIYDCQRSLFAMAVAFLYSRCVILHYSFRFSFFLVDTLGSYVLIR